MSILGPSPLAFLVYANSRWGSRHPGQVQALGDRPRIRIPSGEGHHVVRGLPARGSRRNPRPVPFAGLEQLGEYRAHAAGLKVRTEVGLKLRIALAAAAGAAAQAVHLGHAALVPRRRTAVWIAGADAGFDHRITAARPPGFATPMVRPPGAGARFQRNGQVVNVDRVAVHPVIELPVHRLAARDRHRMADVRAAGPRIGQAAGRRTDVTPSNSASYRCRWCTSAPWRTN